MTFDPSKFVAFDLETHRVQDGLLAPPLVCGSVCSVQGPGMLLSKAEALDALERLLESDRVIVGANIAYDMLVAAVHGVRIRKIFRAYLEGRVFDVQLAEALHAIARGHLGKNPDGSAMLGDDGRITNRYSLYTCTRLVLGRTNAKANDRFRQSYALLEHLPIAEWPAEARTYPIDDAVNTLEVALAQVGRNENLHDLPVQALKHFCLHLGAAWGIRSDPAATEVLAAAAQAGRDAGYQQFVDAGFIRPDGSEIQSAVKRAVAVAYGCTGVCPHCEDGKVYKTGAKGQRLKASTNCQACNGTGLDLSTAPVPMTAPTEKALEKYPDARGNVQTGRDVLVESGDELLMEYAASQEDDKVLDTYVPFLRRGYDAPITLRPNPILDTGRVSYADVIQLLPRQVSARLQAALRGVPGAPVGVRDCFAARAGWFFYSNDYSGGELVTFAESCVNRIGFSEMGQVLIAGADVHARLGARLAGIRPEDFDKKKHKQYRQAAKPANFGFPGGMGALKLVLQQRKGGPDTEWSDGPSDLGDGKRGYKGLRFCVLLGLAQRCGEVKITEYRDRPCPPVCKACVTAAEDIRAAWFSEWPEAKQYLEWHGENVDNVGHVIQHYSKRKRGGVEFCSAANGDFQALLADIAGRALIRVTYEQYVDESSPLFGVSRGIVFAHDELFGEVIAEHGHDVSMRINTIMVEEFVKGCPHHAAACKAEPTLMRRWWKAAEPRWVDGRLVPWEP